MAVVRSVSFSSDVLEYGLGVADDLFGKNFSIFITYLICNYRKNKVAANLREDKELSLELREHIRNMHEVFEEIKF